MLYASYSGFIAQEYDPIMTQNITISITSALNGLRLDKTLVAASGVTGAMSRARIQSLIKKGQVVRGGKPMLDPNHKVRLDEVYTLTLPPPELAKPAAQSMPLDIIYEDADVLVLNKPAGMVVHPAAGNHDHTLVNALLAHCGGSLSGIGGVARPGIVHRLDKDTSGLMVVAKHDAAHQGLTAQFADRSLSRVYQAIVWGVPRPLAGEIEAAICRHPRDRKKMAIARRGGKAALTHYKVVDEFAVGASLVECKLATGRTHQIRVHMASIKHPVVGDPTYGRRRLGGGVKKITGPLGKLTDFPRQALHAMALKFKHPRTGKAMQFKSVLPEDMKLLLKALRRVKP